MLLLAGWSVAPDSGAAEPRALSEVALLSSEQASAGALVTVRGTVGFVEPDRIFLQDDTAGTFVRLRKGENVRPGARLVVTGRTEAGLYLPGIDAVSIEWLDQGPLPAAVEATHDDLLSGRFFCRRVALDGVVRSVAPTSPTRSLVRLALGTKVVEVWVEAPLPGGRSLVDSVVRVEGVALGAINNRRQLVQPYVRVAGWSDVVVGRSAPPDDEVPLISAAELLTYGAGSSGGRVRIEGRVMAVFARGMLYLRSGSAALGVRLATPVPVDVGDAVDVLGFPEMGRFTPALADARLVARRPGPPPEPVRLRLEELFRGSFDNDLVEVTARVTDAFRAERERTLVLQENERRVRVGLLDPNVDVPVGSVVRVTGISRVNLSEGVGDSSQPEAISLYLRSLADVEILRRPSGWTVRRLSLVSAALLGVMLLAALWIALLRRQVRRQAEAARRRIEAEAVLEERNRLARDFHDTLEQELVGLGLRLDALDTDEIDTRHRGLVQTARSLVSRIQAETRNLVGDLRNPPGSPGDLPAALDELLELNAPGGGAVVSIDATGALPPLPAAVVHNLRMIARESVTNALKHAAASRIEVRVTRDDAGGLVLTIQDDGRGFDVARETHGKSGHYGCVGLRERSARLGAAITWRSAPGAGTTVEVRMPLPRNAPAASAEEPRLAPGTASFARTP
jgi:signal transduction histidine kinase